MLNYTGDADVDSTSTFHNKFAIPWEFFSAFYVFGIVGSVLALLHLFQKQKFKNTKQVFLLKCLMMLDFVALMGMLTQMTIRYHLDPDSFQAHTRIFCFARIVWRFLGGSSGCVAFIMAVERYFAFTKPFYYCQHFTIGLIKRLVFIMWTLAAVIIFAPVFGIGIYYDEEFLVKKCVRYRDAEELIDVAYALVCFSIGTVLCLSMVLCNFSVTRIVNRSYRNMQQLMMSCLKDEDNLNRKQQPIKPRNQIRAVSSGNAAAKSISFVTSDEIKFINMCNLLTASFVICWETQMITIPIAQFVKNANQSKCIRIFYQIADLLLLFHFTMDPYIYVLLRTNYWTRFKNFMGQLLFRKDDEFAEISKMDQ